MARIRSVHPGLYTDEAFATVSISARLLLIGIWSHADDGGGFEWKPLSLKMRIFPADNVDVAALLDELAASDIVKRYEVEGRSYGAVRNFGRWQRPKKPVRFCPMPASMRQYSETVPILDKLEGPKKGTSTELDEAEEHAVPDQYGTGSEPVPNQSGISPAEGRKVGRDLRTSSLRSDDAASPVAEEQAVAVIPPDPPLDARTALFRTGVTTVQAMTGMPGPKVRTLIGKWLKDCGDDCAMLNDIIAHAADTRPAEPQAFIAGAIRHRTASDFRQLETNWGLDDVDLDAALRDHERALGL